MDAERFEVLLRALAGSGSRRRALGLLAGGALARLGPQGAVACAAAGHRCRRNGDCCPGAYCHTRRCRCRPGFVRCGQGACVPEGDCCLAARSRCSPDSTPCCGASECTGTLSGQRVCCGLYFHECTEETAAFCCSGRCDTELGRCAPAPDGG